MATAGGLEIHMEIAHKPGARAAQPEAIEAAPAQREAIPLERPRKTGESNRAAVPAIAIFIVIMLLAGVASAFLRRNETTTPLAMVQASASSTADAGPAKVSVTAKSSSGPLAKGITVDGGFD